MALGTNGVIILSKVKSVYNGNIFSVQSTEALQNGQIGHLGDYLSGEKEIRNLVKPLTATLPTTGMVVIAHDEIIYDDSRQSQRALQNFSIEANTPVRAYELAPRDEIQISKGLITPLSTNVVVGNYVIGTNNSYGWTESATLPATSVAQFVAKIIGTNVWGTVTNVGANGNISGSLNMVELEIIRNI